MSGGIILFTSAEIKNLNELELAIYNYIASNQNVVQYMTIRELSLAAHVSTSTILRFCKKMGCEGYSEFKLEFKHYLNSLSKPHMNYDASEIGNFFHHAFHEEFQLKIEHIAEIISRHSCVIFLGIGNSGCTAQYAARYFSNAGKFCLCVTDPFHPVKPDNLLNPIAVAISVSGETEEVISLANRFKVNGCPLISITMSQNCTLAHISDYNLNCYISLNKKGALDFTSQVPILYIIEQLGYHQLDYISSDSIQ
ncbi:MAG: MurR/RpiR family transcriptional regulator [Oliverpabstia sp.]